MANWIVIHDVEEYANHPDFVGRNLGADKEALRQLRQVKKGDNLVYYAKKTGITGYVMDVGKVDLEDTWKGTDPFRRFWNGCEVRHFKSLFPDQKGGLLTLEELRKVSPAARRALRGRGAGGPRFVIELNETEYNRILGTIKERAEQRVSVLQA